MKSILKWIVEKQDKESFEVEFSSLSEWLGKSVESELNHDRVEYSLLIKKLKEKIKALKNITTRDLKVKKELKQLFLQNKVEYLKKIDLLIRKIQLPDSFNSKKLKIFCHSFEESFADFTKRTENNHEFLKNVIEIQIKEITFIIKQLLVIVLKLKEQFLESSKLKALEDIRKRLQIFHQIELSKGKRDKELKRLYSQQKKLSQELEKTKKQLETLRRGDIFKRYEKLSTRLSNLGAEELHLKGTLSALFSELNKILKEQSNNRLFKMYLHNPYQTLLGDEGLKILELFSQQKKKLKKGKMDPDKKDKIVGDLEIYSRELRDLRRKALSLKKSIAGYERAVTATRLDKREKELSTYFQKLENKLSDIVTEIASYTEKTEEINVVSIAKDVEKLIGRKVTITNAPIL